jgi:hypothetical protein
MADRKRDDDRVTHIANLEVACDSLHSDSILERHNEPRDETGLLRVFSLVPRNAETPKFIARIDDGSSGRRREPDLDIDINEVSEVIRRDFNAGRNGYAGHHTDRSPSRAERIFDVEVTLPDVIVFKGAVSFNVTWSVHAHVESQASVSVQTRVIRGGSTE